MEKQFYDLIRRNSSALQNWSVCNIDDKAWYYNPVIVDESNLIFCFSSIDRKSEPFITTISSDEIKRQTSNQGFVDESSLHIQNLLFECIRKNKRVSLKIISKHDLSLDIHISKTIRTLLKTKLYGVCQKVSIEILYQFNNFLLKLSTYQELKKEELFLTISNKDKAIELLSEKINDLLGNQIIDQWAPTGSLLYKYLQPFSNYEIMNISLNDDYQIKDEDTVKYSNKSFDEYCQAKQNWKEKSSIKLTSTAKRPINDDDFFSFDGSHDFHDFNEDTDFGICNILSQQDAIKTESEELLEGVIEQQPETMAKESSQPLRKKKKFGKVTVVKR